MAGGKISKLVVVITDRDTGEHVERWQFDVRTGVYNSYPRVFLTFRPQVEVFGKSSKSKSAGKSGDKENAAPG